MKSIGLNSALGWFLVLAFASSDNLAWAQYGSGFYLNRNRYSGASNQALNYAQGINNFGQNGLTYGGYYSGGYGGLGYNAAFGGYGVSPLGYGGINPYAAGLGGYGSTFFYAPYGYAGYGQALKGSADLVKAYGSLSTEYEQARIMREQYYQTRLDTKKKEFDLQMYIKANTPTYMEIQNSRSKATLERIRKYPLTSEIAAGKALNLLLDDLRKYPNKKTAIEPMVLSEGILVRISVTRNTYGMGLLRDYGKFNWPIALQGMVPSKTRKDIDMRVQELVRAAKNNKLDSIELKNVRDEMDKVRDDLLKKVNEITTPQYMDAKQFLDEFDHAAIALDRGEAPVQEKYERFVEGGKSVQDLIEYMLQNGLRFAPAPSSDEFAYRSVYTTLAAYDVAMSSMTGASKE